MSARRYPIRRQLWIGLLLSCWATIAFANEPPPQSFSAQYVLKRNDVALGIATRSLRPVKDGRYLYASTTSATGVIAWFVKDKIDEHSLFSLEQGRIHPLEYVYDRHGGSKTRRVKLVFDWTKGIVTNVIDGDPWRMEIPPDAHDKLSYQLAIMRDLQNGRKELSYAIADGGKLKNYSFDIIGEEQVDTAYGRLKALKIRRLDDKRATTIWCAPTMSYLPVRLEQQETDGSELSMHLQSVQGLSPQAGTVSKPK